ncbi:MAG: hypothetical protein ACXW3D_01265 [Caulobacteraceae bacterium]
MPRAAQSIDLFAWPTVKAARDQAVAAHDAMTEAQRRVRCAPIGELGNRRNDLQKAVAATLEAELAWIAAIEEAMH